MNEVIEFLKANPVQYLATVGMDGTPKVRPFMFLMENSGKLWFGTNNKKEVFHEMQKTSAIELCVSTPEFAWLRLNGKVVFENNMEIKNACMEIPMLQVQYQTAENPIFEVFYLADAHAVIADMSGNAQKEYNL